MSTEKVSSQPVRASLAAFIGACLRPSTPLARAIVTVLAVKLIAVLVMGIFFATQNVVVDATTIGRLLGPSSPL